MKRVSILGATGSIGTQTLDVIRLNRDKFMLEAISVGENIDSLRKIIAEFKPKLVSVKHEKDVKKLKDEFNDVLFTSGDNGLIDVATYDADILVTAILGSVGLVPTLRAIEQGKKIGLANKETLVAAGDIVMSHAKKYNAEIIPVDSEHSAIFQCLNGEDLKTVKNLIITASGGSFRDLTRDELKSVTKKDALNHPNWSMGQKITIDSATMMNKGLEVIEAHHLFNMNAENIKTLIHRESVIHSMVEFNDNSIMAQIGNSDMRTAIQYALTYPTRIEKNNPLDIHELSTLNFEPMDFNRFKMIQFAYDALKIGGTMPAIMNAANEYAVEKFLNDEITFLEIEDIVESRMNEHKVIEHPDLETILYYDKLYKEDWRS
ncbi:1-deoxy-D-xylulose-5-phosphate reductoisomerase [Nosocomiicoccus ampullae]|uniref:1-deoxy-D-xylulose-5-phosphate reductoisomerase n=1 Tax=Nosocomiicoccus ampullae TaxID=489910 RepID=UPI001C5CCE30|nr:1-deoxy-D-xylulose-5-phosphate reductoisomerase [Nosocomiicoccus ampullae]QYA49050.1 1-deoxy-D-xylulose-5-phosphate reductoisomerase [Nosocomiicoccus ampullae]